jgi:tRNA threonylcarbamoyladenosine biosynthesis protein TsaB
LLIADCRLLIEEQSIDNQTIVNPMSNQQSAISNQQFPMLLLALDTTTKAGSIAVLHDAIVRVEREGNPSATHGQRLPGEIAEVLAAAEVQITDVDLLAVAAGPGSFTGLRVGIATIQGIAMARGKRVVPVSTLHALARAAVNPSRTIGAWMDAQRGEVFAALFSADGGDALIAPVSATPAAVLQDWTAENDLRETIFVGDGAVRHHQVLRAQLGGDVRVVAPPLLAGLIGQIAFEQRDRAVLPHAIVPIYVRRSDAELARARRLSQ